MVRVIIVLLTLVIGSLAAFYLLGTAEAATGTVSPSVTLNSTLSLSLENTENVQWGSKGSGTTQTGTIQARVTANSPWTLTVKRTSDASVANVGLMGEDGNNYINYSNFKYTSAAGSPAPAGSGVTSVAFAASDTDVWTEGTSTSDCRVAITYTLTIPGSQVAQGYTATHTYTLTAAS